MKQDNAISRSLNEMDTLKDNILQSFYDRDFATTIMLADKLESMLDILGADLCEQECLGLMANAVANAALEVIKATKAQAQSKITKQAIKYAKITKEAYKMDCQILETNATNAKSKSLESHTLTQKSLESQSPATNAQNQMQFFDYKLALAYASNGDIIEAKEILATLAKPYLPDTYADFSDEANIAYGGGGNNSNLKNNNAIKSNILKSSSPKSNPTKSSLTNTQNPQSTQFAQATQNPQIKQTPPPPQTPPNIPPYFAKNILCALAEIHTFLGELDKAEAIYRAILHSDYLLNIVGDFATDIWTLDGRIDQKTMRPIESFWRLYEKISEQKSLDIFYEILERLQKIVENLNSTNKQIPYISPHSHKRNNEQPLFDRLSQNPKTIGANDAKIKQIQNYIDCMILPGIAFYLYSLYRDRESLNLYKELESKNTHNSDFWSFYGDTLWQNRFYQEAYNAFMRSNAISQNPNALFSCSKMLLQLLDDEEMYMEGLALYENRLALIRDDKKDLVFSMPHYKALCNALQADENALRDKVVFIVSEQGYGDTIMFAPALAKLCQIAKKVLFMPQSNLFRLFDYALKSIKSKEPQSVFENLHIIGSLPKDKIYENKDGKYEEKELEFQKPSARLGFEFDYVAPICSLPYLLKMSLDEWLALPRPLLPIKRESNAKRESKATKTTLKIAIFWHTNSSGNYERFKKDCPLEIITNAFENSPYSLVSFQVRERVNGKLEDFIVPDFIQNRGENLKDWQDTFEGLSDIDMIISIDSALAHLGLSIGIPTLVLLPLRFDWRWGDIEYPKSPFYPHAHLVVFDSNPHDSKMLKRNKSTSQKIRKIADEILAGQ